MQLARGKYLELLELYISVIYSIAHIMIGRLYICGKLLEEIAVHSFVKTDAQMEDNIYGVAFPLRRYYLPSVLGIDYGDYVRSVTMKTVIMKIE